MSSVVQSDLIPSSLTGSLAWNLAECAADSTPETKSKKKRKPKKKAANGSNQINADASVTNMPETSNQITEDKDDRQEVSEDDFSQDESAVKDAHTLSASLPTATVGVALVNGSESHAENGGSSDSTKRFDALVRERDALRAEVTQFRESMEELQSKHQRELEEANIQLQDTQSEKEQAEEQYQNLLGKVNTIRSQLGDRLKADAVCSLRGGQIMSRMLNLIRKISLKRGHGLRSLKIKRHHSRNSIRLKRRNTKKSCPRIPLSLKSCQVYGIEPT